MARWLKEGAVRAAAPALLTQHQPRARERGPEQMYVQARLDVKPLRKAEASIGHGEVFRLATCIANFVVQCNHAHRVGGRARARKNAPLGVCAFRRQR